ncbi:MAG: divergent PAP2 family protein [Spirochaetes bacterium]|nr:divergent PAP2 family protein [Spirochaetota bacterium]
MNLSISPLLLASAGIQIACQSFKVVYYSIREGTFNGWYFFSAGGIPSAHAAFVTSLTVGIGLRSGFDSDLFAVSFVFSAIVIYDAFRLRGAVERHAKLLNRITSRYYPEEHENLNERIGHSLGEILSGILIGGGLMLLLNFGGVL